MNIKWESNSRVKSLALDGRIKDEDIISRTSTEKFPPETCTVRMARPREKVPFITLHIRGKSRQKTFAWQNRTVECAETCRVNFGGSYDSMMCSSGNLDENLSWLDVHEVVERVKETLKL